MMGVHECGRVHLDSIEGWDPERRQAMVTDAHCGPRPDTIGSHKRAEKVCGSQRVRYISNVTDDHHSAHN